MQILLGIALIVIGGFIVWGALSGNLPDMIRALAGTGRYKTKESV